MQLTAFLSYLILAPAISFLLDVNALGSVVIFLIIPSLHLSLLLKGNVKKAAMFSLFTAVPFIIFSDYIAHLTKQWLVPDTVFPVRILDLVPVEDILWAFFLTYFIIMF